MEDAHLVITYAGRWDPQERRPVEPLSVAEARRRHTAFEPYVAVLGAPDRPDVLVESDGQRGDLTVWTFDGYDRRAGLFEFRIIGPERMGLLRMAEWRYLDGRPEFDRASPRCVTTFDRNGVKAEVTGGEPDGWRLLDGYDRWHDVPTFGKWTSVLRFVLAEPPVRERHHVVEPTPHDRPLTALPAAEPPRFSGRGLAPGPEVAAMFGPARRYDFGPESERGIVHVETRPAGVLLAPTGRLVAADPGLLGEGLAPFAATIQPGRYPVTIAGFDNGARFVVAGCRVSVRDEPVAVWEEALRVGEEPSAEGKFYATGVDSGTLAFLDASALPGLVEAAEEGWDEPRGVWDDIVAALDAGPTAELADPRTDTNMIMFSSGWGDGAYPVWLGRNDDGEVVCFVADTWVLFDVEPLD